jgi:hypothetical protein
VHARATFAGGSIAAKGDEAVEVNLDPWEVSLWRKVKSRFRGRPDARLRAFREYVSKHPKEIYTELEGVSAAKTAKLLHEKGKWVGVEVPCAPPWRYRNKASCRIKGGGS